MDKDSNVESRLRRFAQAFRREANPPGNLASSMLAGLGQTRRHDSRFAIVPAAAMAALVLVAGLVVGYGALQLRNLGRSNPTPPISLVTPTPSATATESASPTATPVPTSTPTPPATGAPMQAMHLSLANAAHAWATGIT